MNKKLKTNEVYEVIGVYRDEEIKALYLGKLSQKRIVNNHILAYKRKEIFEFFGRKSQIDMTRICMFSNYSFENDKLKIGKKHITYPYESEIEFLENKLKFKGLIENA